ncbi:hypothetical protein IE987_31390 [Klebsiella pneumoniae]|uniref:Uncharacterized protein n=1 Tax=Klebsiella pneumoniae TaxID=573 RepID=A0A927DQ31_KLEPN|nr:hypothetical protein [Klebsiella pneumoniae]
MWITELGLISIAFASYILLALVVHLTLKQASYNGKVSSPAVNHACQQTSFLQPVCAVDFCQQYYPLDARPGREIASKKIAAIKGVGVYIICIVRYR